MPYEFITKNGLISQGNVTVTGSLITSQNVTASNISASGTVIATSFTGSLLGTSSWATNALTASYLTTANSYIVTNLTASNISASGTGSFGYVGIGTTNPGSRLTVSGSIESLTDNGGEGGQLILRGNTYRYNIDNFNGQALRFFREDDSTTSNGVTYMMISASGNVGIGTTVPNSKLEVAGTAGTGVVSVTNTGNGRSGSFGIDGNGVFIRNSTNGDYFDLENASGTSKFRVVYDNNTFLNTTYTSVGSLTASGSKLSVFGNLSVGSTYGATESPANGLIVEGNVGIGTTSTTVQSNYRFLQVNGTNSAVIEALVGGTRIGGIDSDSTNLYVGSIGSYPIVFRTAVNEKMRITAAGLVGIGTSSPAQKLEVQSGSVLIRGDGTALFGTYYASAGENTFFTLHSGSGNTFHIGNDVAGTNYNTMVFTAATDTTGGKVGIGTSSPGSKLQINDDTPVLTIRTNDGGVSRKAYIDFYTTFFNFPSDVGARRTSTIVTGFDSGVWGTEFLAFNVGSGSANDSALLPIERVRIDGSGNLGIGTSRPATKLDVKGHIFVANAANGNNTIAFGNIGGLGPLNGAPDNLTGSAFLVVSSSTASGAPSHMKFYTTTGGTCGERMRIDESGNIGMGTISPNAKLQVVGNISGTSFTSSISNAVGFLGTSSWASNVLSASFATTAQTANTLNASNTYSIAGLTSAYVDVNGSSAPTTGIYRPSTKTLGLSADSTLIFKISNVSAPATSSVETGNFVVQSGNVGLGTNSPNNKLDIFGATGTTLNMSNVDDGSRGGKLTFISSSATGRQFYVGTNSSIYNLVFGIDSIERARIDTSGNLGIGITNPSSRLHISGSSSTAITITDDALYTNSITNDNSVMTYTVDTGNAAAASAAHVFRRFNTELVRIDPSGNVGIGTTTPSALLELSSSTAANLFNIKGARGNNILYVSGSGNIGINSIAFDPLAPEALLISGSTYNIISADTNINTYGQVHTQNRNAGTAASSDLVATNDTGTELGNYVDMGINSSGYTAGFIGNANDGYLYNTGSQFYIGNASPGRNLYFFAGSTTNTASMMLSASGNVGIGTTNATDKFTVYGALASYKTGADTIQTQVYLANTGNTRAFNLQLNSGGTGLDLWSYNSANAWLRHTTFDYNGSVGIGTATAILGKLQLDSGVAPYYGPATSSATPNGFLTLGSTSSDVVNTFGVDATSTAYAWIQPRKASAATYYSLVLNPNGGNVGIGTVTPAAKLEITGSSNSALLNIKSPISGAILYVSGSGAVGIGTSNVGAFTLQVSGSFGATTKSFIIDHPTKAGKKLMYGSLESPYHGIRLTGRDTLKDGKCKIQLPDYIYKLILHDSVNIQLTGIKCNKTLYVDDINIPENYFTIAYDKAIFESYKDYDFFWDFTAIRADVPELITEM